MDASSAGDTLQYAHKQYKLEINKELKLLEIFEKKPQRSSRPVKREEVRKRINIPAKYYINRGYYPETLDLFDVGLCLEKNRNSLKWIS